MIIAIDVDEVLANFLEQYLKFQEATYGRKISFDDVKTYYFRDIFFFFFKQEISEIYEFYDTPFFKHVRPLPDSIDVVKELKRQGHTLHVITARQHKIATQTKDWINTHFPNLFEDVIITNEAAFGNTNPLKKVDVCKQLNAHVIIEDSHSNACDAAREHITAILINKPWNKNKEDVEGIHRVDSLREALSVLSRL